MQMIRVEVYEVIIPTMCHAVENKKYQFALCYYDNATICVSLINYLHAHCFDELS